MSAASSFDVQSRDGTRIAVHVGGFGPAIVLVHGSIADHTTLDPFVDVLQQRWTTFAMDRRGFGASEDTTPYAIEREFEDVAAVVDAASARTGGPVALFGHSYGANCTIGGATLTDNVHHLVAYEPSLGLRYPDGSIARVEDCLACGDREGAIVEVLTGVLAMTPDEVDALRANPLWPTRIAAAHTVPRECYAEEGWAFTRGQFDRVTAPTLLLSGTESVPAIRCATDAAVAAIPGARVLLLEGHGHFAHKTDPQLVERVVAEFAAG